MIMFGDFLRTLWLGAPALPSPIGAFNLEVPTGVPSAFVVHNAKPAGPFVALQPFGYSVNIAGLMLLGGLRGLFARALAPPRRAP